MILRHKHLSPIDRQLEAFGEPWQLEQDEARDGEDMIAVANNLFHMLREREEAWRDQVFRGVATFFSQDDLDQRERNSRRLDAAERTLSTIGQSAGTIAVAGQLRDHVAEAKRMLERWQSPGLSSAVGLREMTLSAESATELDEIVSRAKTTPPPMPQRRMATQDASFLKAPGRTVATSDE